MSCHQNAGQNNNLKSANKYPEKAAKLTYLRTAVTNQNFVHEEV